MKSGLLYSTVYVTCTARIIQIVYYEQILLCSYLQLFNMKHIQRSVLCNMTL